jgi:hypothetical protein
MVCLLQLSARTLMADVTVSQLPTLQELRQALENRGGFAGFVKIHFSTDHILLAGSLDYGDSPNRQLPPSDHTLRSTGRLVMSDSNARVEWILENLNIDTGEVRSGDRQVVVWQRTEGESGEAIMLFTPADSAQPSLIQMNCTRSGLLDTLELGALSMPFRKDFLDNPNLGILRHETDAEGGDIVVVGFDEGYLSSTVDHGQARSVYFLDVSKGYAPTRWMTSTRSGESNAISDVVYRHDAQMGYVPTSITASRTILKTELRITTIDTVQFLDDCSPELFEIGVPADAEIIAGEPTRGYNAKPTVAESLIE